MKDRESESITDIGNLIIDEERQEVDTEMDELSRILNEEFERDTKMRKDVKGILIDCETKSQLNEIESILNTGYYQVDKVEILDGVKVLKVRAKDIIKTKKIFKNLF